MVTLATVWAPVVFSLVFAVTPGSDNALIIGNETLLQQLGIDVMADLDCAALRGLRQNAEVSVKEVAVMATTVKKQIV